MILNREKVEFYLTDLETPVGKVISVTIALLVLVSSGIFVAETYDLSPDTRFELRVLDDCVLIIFAVEYLLRLWSTKDKIKYILSFYAIIDLMSILPSFIGLVDISFIRLLRWFRILRLLRFIDKKFLIGSISNQDGVIFARILFTLFAIVFVFSGLIYQVEHPVNPESFDTSIDDFNRSGSDSLADW